MIPVIVYSFQPLMHKWDLVMINNLSDNILYSDFRVFTLYYYHIICAVIIENKKK